MSEYSQNHVSQVLPIQLSGLLLGLSTFLKLTDWAQAMIGPRYYIINYGVK